MICPISLFRACPDGGVAPHWRGLALRRLARLLSAGVAVAGLWSPVARGEDGAPEAVRLSRRESVRQALAHNPGILAARELVAEAKAQITVATALPDPSLVTELDQLRNFWSPSSGTERDVGVQFTVPYPNRTRLNGRIARAGWRAAEWSLAQLEQQIAAQTVQAYDALLVARRHRDDLVQGRDLSAQFLDKTRERFRGGLVPRLDTLKAEVDLAKAENDLIANERTIATSQAALNRLLGRPLHAELAASDALEVPAALPAAAALEQVALRSRPELRGLAEQRQAARDATKLSRQYWAPDLNFTLWRSDIVGAPRSYKFDGGISLPLFFWQHQRGQVAQARHRELELAATNADLESQVLLDISNAYAAASTARRQAVYLRDSLLPEARRAFEVTLQSYNLGGSSALELLDAKGTLLSAEGDYADALGAVNDAMADLERAAGAPLPPGPPDSSHDH